MDVVGRASIVLMALVALVGAFGSEQTSECTAKAAARDLVRRTMAWDSSHQLRATRREDWEDDLFGLQVKVKGNIAKAAYFFEVTETGYFVLSPDEAVYVDTMDGRRYWVVAVSKKVGEAHGLYGFPRAAAEFRTLASDSHLAVQSEADAKATALLFCETVKDPRGLMLVFHSRQLKRRVEDFFLSKLPESKAERRSRTWWRGLTTRKRAPKLGVAVTTSGEDYTVTVPLIRSHDGETLQLLVLALTVRSTGACTETGAKVLYASSG